MIFARGLHRLWERVRGRYREGIDAPERLARIVNDFARWYPDATREEWIAFAIAQTAESYRSGYIRGYEHVERIGVKYDPSPETVADDIMPGWRDGSAVDPRTGVPKGW